MSKWLSAGLLALGSLLAAVLLHEPRRAVVAVPTAERLPLERCSHCGITGPQLHPSPSALPGSRHGDISGL